MFKLIRMHGELGTIVQRKNTLESIRPWKTKYSYEMLTLK